MGCGDEKLSKYLTQTFTAHCNAVICQQVTLSGDAEWPQVADAVIEAERVAINLLDYRMVDNAGHQAVDEPIVPDGPAAYFVTLPVRAMLDAVRMAGIPAELSLSAGAFLCNQVTYELLHYLTIHQLAIPTGFVHLPALPEQVINAYPPMPSMALETMVRGICAVIGALQATVPSLSGRGVG